MKTLRYQRWFTRNHMVAFSAASDYTTGINKPEGKPQRTNPDN